MTKRNDLVLVDEKYLENRIYIIRGQKVMLDKDLAEIYGYSTKVFNRQVQRNKEKFIGEDFMFQLNDNETYSLSRCQFGTSIMQTKGMKGGRVFRPYAFTESGVYMLMTVLKGPLAIKQSRALIRLFKGMKDYLIENRNLIPTKELELRTTLLEKDVNDIKQDNKEFRMDLKKVMNNFIDPSAYKHFLILDGRKLEADLAYKKIFSSAKESIIYIDDYIGLKTLDLLSCSKKNVSITIISDNKSKELKEYMINDYSKQNKTNKITLLKTNNMCHDRYIVIDYNTDNEMIYHCGASLKDAGNKITTIQKIEDPSLYNKTIKELLKHNHLNLN